MRHATKVIHILVFTLTVHVWHIVASDRMLDAYADVAIDKVATVGLKTIHVAAGE